VGASFEGEANDYVQVEIPYSDFVALKKDSWVLMLSYNKERSERLRTLYDKKRMLNQEIRDLENKKTHFTETNAKA